MPTTIGTFIGARRQGLGLTEAAFAGRPGTENDSVPSAPGRDAARSARVDRVLVLGHGHPNGHDLGEGLPALPAVAGETRVLRKPVLRTCLHEGGGGATPR
jgi:hypothetical protein